MQFTAFDKQKPVLKSDKKIIGAFAGKRGGKSEVGAIKSIMWQDQRPDYESNGIDPYLGIIAAPTNDMLTRLSWKKFTAYAKPFIKRELKSPFKLIEWHNSKEGDESLIYGISADRPERIEGVKANWIWIDEVFQVSEQFFLECLARVSDSEGYLLCTGSLGVQFVNPKQHWCYKYFKEQIDDDVDCFEWGTEDNPYFPKSQLEKAKKRLDKATYKAMYQIDWNVSPKTAVYSDFNEDNIIKDLQYNPRLPVIASIDWGWAHPMAAGIFQYDKKNDIIYLIDELVQSKVKLENLYVWLSSRPYHIDTYYADVAGNQEREQSGMSNIRWFWDNYQINIKSSRSRIIEGISVVRRYICNTHGKRRFFISSKCTESIDGVKRYAYPEKDGIIKNENPIKENDDAVDMIRYYFINNHKYKENKSYITFE